MNKTIGIIGGMTPKSTVLMYNHIIDMYQRKFDDYAFPEILIYSVSFQNYVNWMQNNNWDTIADDLKHLGWFGRDMIEEADDAPANP